MTATSDLTDRSTGGVDSPELVPARIVAAWAAQDGEQFAEVFTPDGSMILPGQQPSIGRSAIAGFMTAAFAGPYQGTQVTGDPVDMRFLSDDVAVVLTRGGVRRAGASELAPEDQVNATWIVVRTSDGWQLAAYHNSPNS